MRNGVKVKTDISIAHHSKTKKLTSEALMCGSHSFHTANTPHLPLPVSVHHTAPPVVIAAICLQLTIFIYRPREDERLSWPS